MSIADATVVEIADAADQQAHHLRAVPSPSTSSSSISLSIIVPVLNEERTVLGVIDELLSVDYGCPAQVIVVDDGSTDSTPQLLAGVTHPRVQTFRHPTNFGKGAALRTGARIAMGTHLVPFDADGEYDAADLPRLMEPIIRGKTSVVYGSRIFGNNTVYQSYRYAVGNRFLTLTANLLFDAYITDMHTCLKVVPVDTFRELRLRRTDFGLDTELTAALLRRGIRTVRDPDQLSQPYARPGQKNHLARWRGVPASAGRRAYPTRLDRAHRLWSVAGTVHGSAVIRVRIWVPWLVVSAVALIVLGLAQSDAGRRITRTWGLTAQPAQYSALSFSHVEKLPYSVPRQPPGRDRRDRRQPPRFLHPVHGDGHPTRRVSRARQTLGHSSAQQQPQYGHPGLGALSTSIRCHRCSAGLHPHAVERVNNAHLSNAGDGRDRARRRNDP